MIGNFSSMLQEVGEHAHCGQGNLPHSGFSYDPESFMAAGVGVYNFSWRDMGVPTLYKMLDIVQAWTCFVPATRMWLFASLADV